jgi:hypothetical protein
MTQTHLPPEASTDAFALACDALERAGVAHAQLRGAYARAVLDVLSDARPVLCGERWDEQQTCSLPAGHGGWHASNPVYDVEQRRARAGGTWSRKSPARYGV